MMSPQVKGNKSKKVKGKKAKKRASFKVNGKKGGLKSGTPPTDELGSLMYKDTYCLDFLPKAALPQDKPNLGKHSYTLTKEGGATIEVLLKHPAFFVKKLSPKGVGPIGQLAFVKLGGEKYAWIEACRRAGCDPAK